MANGGGRCPPYATTLLNAKCGYPAVVSGQSYVDLGEHLEAGVGIGIEAQITAIPIPIPIPTPTPACVLHAIALLPYIVRPGLIFKSK